MCVSVCVYGDTKHKHRHTYAHTCIMMHAYTKAVVKLLVNGKTGLKCVRVKQKGTRHVVQD